MMAPTNSSRRVSPTLGLSLMALYTFLFLPLAQPFVSGSTPSGSSSSSLQQKHHQLGAPLTQPPPPPPPPPARTSDSGPSHLPPPLTSSASSVEGEPRRRVGLWKWLRRSGESTTPERNASLLSRLFFRYATPLVQAASKRQLTAEDSFDMAPQRRMEPSVARLASIHQRFRQEQKSKKQRSTTTQSSSAAVSDGTFDDDKAANEAAWVLTKALFTHQRRQLMVTGFLRLLNTACQAFPALLVSRLLRLVEAGKEVPAREAVVAAVTLVSVLSCKMILENQYFHRVVQSATNVRGSLSGLLFDKALTLPGGGAGVVHPSSESSKTLKKKKKRAGKDLAATSDDEADSATPSATSSAIGSGGVLNLMQSDTSLIESAALQIHTTWDGLLQLSLYTFLLYRFLGPSALYGCAVLVGTIPLNSVTLRVLNRLAKYENRAKDARTKRTAESIAHMSLLKLFGWEENFANDIRRHRRDELQRHVSRGAVRAFNSALSNAVPSIVLVVTLKAYARTGRPLMASTIFTAISLFNQLRFPLWFYPMLIDSLANGRNAMRRIANFLEAETTVPYVQHLPPLSLPVDAVNAVPGVAKLGPPSNTGGAIEMKHGNFLWSVSKSSGANNQHDDGDGSNDTSDISSNGEEAAPALANVELNVKPGEVVAVVGPVGSGKSALLKGLLGELNPVPRPVMEQLLGSSNSATADSVVSAMDQRPTVTANGQVAYCSQEAWLPKGTIREAVVFGRKYDEERYLSALRDAGLDNDIVDYDFGVEADEADLKKGQLSHDTDVGEHGASLSGGQRARVALARALYADDETKVYLLDDCLAALDASVGSTVFERLTARLRARNAAVLLVTNDPSLPRRCDRTLLMGKAVSNAKATGTTSSCSTIVDDGSYDDLIARGHDLKSIASTEEEEEGADGYMDHQMEDAALDRPVRQKEILSATNHSLQYFDPPKLMKLKKNNVLHVFGGANDTVTSAAPISSWSKMEDCHGSSCHADPETQYAMECCPDSISGQQRLSVRGDETGDGMLFVKPSADVVLIYNDTEVVSTRPESRRAKGRNSGVSGRNATTSVKTGLVASADESMTSGAVPISTYVSYVKSVRKPILVAAMLLSFLTVNGAQVFQQYTVARWSDVAKGDAMAAVLGARYMQSLVNAAGVVSVFMWFRSFFTMQVGVRASEFLHSKMLSSVFAAPLAFFDSTDSGQLLTRFGKETETIDRSVPESIQSTLFCFLQIFSSFAALASVITPGMLVPLAAVGFLYARTMGLFRPAARDLKLAETKTRSPIYTHFGEALRGAETIRSVPGAKRVWATTHRSLTDVNLGVFHTVKSMDRWLSTRLENLGNLVVFTAAMASVYLTRSGRLTAGSAGWGLTQSLSITGLLTWAVRCLTDLETNMMSVQRVKELTDIDAEERTTADSAAESDRARSLMPREPSEAGEALAPLMRNSNFEAALAPLDNEALMKSGWPWRGNVRFRNVSMRYNPSAPLVLRDVSLTVPAGSTLGVVGRTGSGKSSLLLTLFRLMEIESGGSIEIDGVDIRALSLKALRQSLAIIPQDPTLFQGTVGSNLDATGMTSDSEMWIALEAASPELAEQFRQNKGLQSEISEGGKNLSQGQRQLICLARALLRRSKILVLDEATSSVDSQTDQAVQATIRREFVDKGVTVITVAHRLETVLGYDNIAVLGAGSVLEYGAPKQLLQNPSGELRQLVDADQASRRKGSSKSTASQLPSFVVSAG